MATTKIEVTRTSGLYHLTSTNEHGNSVESDGSPEIGGDGKGIRPMEMMLASLASCSTIDVVLILNKQRQQLDDIKITVEAEKEKMDTYSRYSKIHLHFDLYGKIKDAKAKQAIDLSLEKYCSVAMALKATSEITTSYTIHEQG